MATKSRFEPIRRDDLV